MIELIELLQVSIDANEKTFELFIEEAKANEIRTEFNIGKMNVDTHDISTSQKIYMASMVWSRQQGCKELGDDELLEETTKDVQDFKDSLDYQVKRDNLLNAIAEDKGYLREAKTLLTNDDKRTLLIAKVKRETRDL